VSQVSVLQSPRHACSGCGACCQGSVVHLVSQQEVDRVREQAAELGVPDPVDQGHLRLQDGRCCFLGQDRRCTIHARFGGASKPLVCRQFPLVLIQTDDGLRAGVDPASTAWRTTRDTGPELTFPQGIRPRRAPLPAPQAAVERQLVSACTGPDATLAGLLSILCAAPDAPPDLPPGLADRWLQIVRQAPLTELLHHAAVGPDHRAVLLPVLQTAARLDTAPELDLPAELQADALALIRDTLWLRLISRIPLVQATALLLAGGVLLCAWHDPRPDRFGLALSTWCRLLRAGPFWQAMVPEPARLQWLATGT